MIRIVVNNVKSRLCDDNGILDDPNIRFYLRQDLSYYLKNSYWMGESSATDKQKAAGHFNDGRVDLYWPAQGHTFYTGMMSNILTLLKARKIPYVIEDRRPIVPANLQDLAMVETGKEPRSYQHFTVDKCVQATRGIIHAATGAGKTYIVAMLINQLKTSPFLFIVPSKDLLYQAQAVLAANLNEPIGIIGDGQVDIQKINVIMIQTAIRAINWMDKNFDPARWKYDEEDKWDDNTIDKNADKIKDIMAIITRAKGLYFDEVHHAAAKTCREVLKAAKNAYWRFGGSATPFREDGQDKMIQALFGRRLVDISPSWLIKNGYLVKPYIFNIKINTGASPFVSYPSIYKDKITNNAVLNDLVHKIHSQLRKTDIPFLTLVQRYGHGDNLCTRDEDLPFIKGNMTRKRRREAIAALVDGTIPGAIATTLADEGLDVERLGAVLVAGGGKSITRVYQRVGRALRLFPDKKRALIFLFHHHCKYLESHGNRVKSILSEEEEFVVTNTTPERIISDIEAVTRPERRGLFDLV